LQIDYTKFASVAGLKSPASARELMRVTKKKLREEYGALAGKTKASNGADEGSKTPQKATPAGKNGGAKKRASQIVPRAWGACADRDLQAQEEAEGDGDDEGVDTPMAKRGKGLSSIKKEVVEGGEEDDIFS